MAALCARLQLHMKDDTTLLLAITDRTSDDTAGASNCRLAAVGRQVLSAALSEYLYVRYPRLPGDQIIAAVSMLTSKEILLRAAINTGLPYLVRSQDRADLTLYKPETQQILADAFAAVVGAVFVDRGTFAAHELGLNVLAPVVEHRGVASLAKLGDPKGTLSRLLEEEGFGTPDYKVTGTTGGDLYDAVHVVEVYSGDRLLADGAGFTVAMAEAEAAKAALLREYTTEVEDVVLPSSWGDFAHPDAVAMVAKLVPADAE